MLYGRQSQTDEESISLDLQETANRAHCDRNDYDVVAVLNDPDISGRKWANRPSAVEAVRMIADREADAIVAWKWSRVSRRRLDFEVALDRVETSGGRIESSTEPIDTTTASGRFHRGVLADVAQFESERIGEGWKETHASRRARGVPPTGGDRYGYRRVKTVVPDTGKVITTGYEIDEGDEDRKSPAEALRRAYSWSVAGWGNIRICRTLNAQGFRNIRGELFKVHGIWPLLDSGFAAGLVVQRHHRRTTEEGAYSYHEGAQPRIIDRGTWDAYVRSRRTRSFTPPRRLTSPHPLSGFMRCGDCGSSMIAVGRADAQNKAPMPTWVCRRWRSVGSQFARCVSVTRHRAEQAVRDWLSNESADIEHAAASDRRLQLAQRKARTNAERAAANLGELNRRLAELELSDLRSRAPEAWRQARDTLFRELDDAQALVEEADAAAARPTVEVRSTAGRLLAHWPAPGTTLLPPEDIRAVLASMIRGVWVMPPQRRGLPSTLQVVAVWEDPPALVGPAIPWPADATGTVGEPGAEPGANAAPEG